MLFGLIVSPTYDDDDEKPLWLEGPLSLSPYTHRHIETWGMRFFLQHTAGTSSSRKWGRVTVTYVPILGEFSWKVVQEGGEVEGDGTSAFV